MKKMSCFCASNSSGDSVYSGYFRWRMGLPLPPIPQEDSHIKSTNKDIFNNIIGVKHVSDFTLEESEPDETLRRFRRRKNEESSNNPIDRVFVSKDNIKGFRENPMYISSVQHMLEADEEFSTSLNSFLDYYPMKDEVIVPSPSESFNINNNLKNNNVTNDCISSFLVKKFLTNIEEYSENGTVANMDEDSEDKNINNNQVPSKPIESINAIDIKEPPAIPPHRKQSIMTEEIESNNGTIKCILPPPDKENIELINNNKVESNQIINSPTTPIPIFSIKHGDIDKILSESIGEYDYAYNKSWSKGVEFNLSMNLSEDEKTKQIRTVNLSNQFKNDINLCKINENKTNFIEKEIITILQPQNSFPDESGDSISVHSFPNIDSIQSLKLSSIEADVLTQNQATLSGNSQISSSIAESESDSRNEPWDVIHRRSIKELIGTRFIDPSIINNNKQPLIKEISVEKSKINCGRNSGRNQMVNSSSESKLSKENIKRSHITINAKIPLEKQPWYHFYLTRSRAESLMTNHPDGSFLVRRSESNKNAYSLTIKHKGLFLHMKITKNHKGFVLGEYSQPYQSIPHMLYHYCLTVVPVKGADAASLRYAVTRDHL